MTQSLQIGRSGAQARIQSTIRSVRLLSVTSTIVAVLPVALTGALAIRLRRSLGLSLTDFGIAVAGYYASSALFSAPVGWLGQRLGPRDAIRLGLLAGALSMVGLGAIATSMPGLLTCLIAAGLANAIVHPAVNQFLATSTGGGQLGSAVGLKQAAVPASLLLSGVSVPLLAIDLGWRAVFLAGAIGAMSLWCVWTLQPSTEAGAEEDGRAPPGKLSALAFAALAVAGGLASMGSNAMGAFLVSSAVSIHLGDSQAALLLAACSAVCVAVRLGAGLLADRRAGREMQLFAALLVGGALGYLGLRTHAAPLFIAAALLAFGCGWGWPGVLQFAVIASNRGIPAAATGITQTGVYLGAAAGPLIFGMLATSSYALAWTAMSVVSLGAAAMGLLIALRPR